MDSIVCEGGPSWRRAKEGVEREVGTEEGDFGECMQPLSVVMKLYGRHNNRTVSSHTANARSGFQRRSHHQEGPNTRSPASRRGE